MLFDRSPRSIASRKSWRCETATDAWSASMQSPSIRLFFFSFFFFFLLPFFLSTSSFLACSFRRSSIESRTTRDAHTNEKKRESKIVLQLERGSDRRRASHDFCLPEKAPMIRIFRYFYRSNGPPRGSVAIFAPSSKYLPSKRSSELYRFNSLASYLPPRCSRAFYDPSRFLNNGPMLRDYDLTRVHDFGAQRNKVTR